MKHNISHTKSMPSSSTQTTETASYDAVHMAPFTSIHWWPTRHDYEILKKEASNLASEVDNLHRRRVWTPCWNHRQCWVHPSHKPNFTTGSWTHKLQFNHHCHHSDTLMQMDWRRIGGEMQVLVHPKGFPMWHHHEYSQHTWQAVLLTAQACQYRLPKHHLDPNPQPSRHLLVPSQCPSL